AGVRERLRDLVHAAQRGGADAVMFSCSSISGYAAGLQEELGIPVLRIDEAMADEAVASGRRVAVLATLPTTLAPTVALLRERAEAAGRDVQVQQVLIEGAVEAVSSGDRDRHDALVARRSPSRPRRWTWWCSPRRRWPVPPRRCRPPPRCSPAPSSACAG